MVAKGGLYWRLLGFMREHHARIARAILGAASEDELPHELFVSRQNEVSLYAHIRDGQLPATSATYRRLHALAASLFVSMAQRMTMPGERLHNPNVPTAQRHEWFATGLRIPSAVVAELACAAVTKVMSVRLQRAERERDERAGFIVECVMDAHGSDAVLLWMGSLLFLLLTPYSLLFSGREVMTPGELRGAK